MTGTIAQVRPADERLAERLAEEYRQARIDMGPREAAAEWFTPLLRKWRRLLAGKGEGFTAREQLALAVTLDADFRSRDTLIVTAISPEVSMKQLRVMVEERYSLKSTALLERVLEGWFHAGQKPDTSRLDLAVDILAGFVERVPQSRRAQLLTVPTCRGRPAMSAARRNGGSRPYWRTRNARWPPSWSRPASTECCLIGRSEQRHDSGGPPGAARRFPLQSLRQLFFERKPIMETANTIAAINETTGLAPAAGGVVMLETALIDPNPANPRRDVGDVGELADSIRAQGIRQNLLVVPAPEGRFTLVIGHRRLAAAKLAGLERVPAVVAELDEREQRELMLVENSQRTDLTVVEEADGYQGLLDLGSSVEEAARKTGRSVSLVRRRLKVAAIDDDVRSHVGAAQLSIEDWETIADYEAWPDLQERLATIFTPNSRSDSMRVELRANSKVNTTARTTEVNGLTATSCTFTANW